ncbi:sensor histidine kinase [Ramlibacter sp. MMS24-I3-19]|uniref:sensor histidine kinase n=1 Tax=Ramlibacter sp. MMS24-I3-19 TaxID=3416606 RepID=UPI003CFE08D4
MAAAPVRRFTLVTRLALLAGALVLATTAVALVLSTWLQSAWQAAAFTVAVMLPLAVVVARAELQPLLAMLRALGGTVISYRDGDFSVGLHWAGNDEIGDLVRAHNELGQVLREQRRGLAERELLLDTMVQNTPVAMLLVHQGGRVVFGNLAARQLLHRGRRLEGDDLARVLNAASASLREAYARGGDGLFTVRHAEGSDGEDEIYHLARRQFTLNGQRHELLLLRHLTAELRRQEVQTWKKVIRVLSHELNNSLAPAASLAHSGAELLRRDQTERLPEILRTIEERTRHLQGFIDGYARFAKLPAPRLEDVHWPRLVRSLQAQVPFALAGALPEEPARVDAAQMEQALLNLLKNAHESGSPADDVAMAVRRTREVLAIDVMDRGTGMTETVMAQALVPFYSTKRSGTGLGLALAREIAEAHGGRIVLGNREGGGLTVSLVLPATA